MSLQARCEGQMAGQTVIVKGECTSLDVRYACGPSLARLSNSLL